MKPFNLEQAFEDDPVITRTGLPVTQLNTFTFKDNSLLLIGVVADTQIHQWNVSGKCTSYFKNNVDRDFDLFMGTKTLESWVNVYIFGTGDNLKYTLSRPFNSEQDAKRAQSAYPISEGVYLKTIKIHEWDE